MLGSAIGEIYYNAQTTEARAAQKVMDEEAENRKRGTDFAIREEERKNKALVQASGSTWPRPTRNTSSARTPSRSR